MCEGSAIGSAFTASGFCDEIKISFCVDLLVGSVAAIRIYMCSSVGGHYFSNDDLLALYGWLVVKYAADG